MKNDEALGRSQRFRVGTPIFAAVLGAALTLTACSSGGNATSATSTTPSSAAATTATSAAPSGGAASPSDSTSGDLVAAAKKEGSVTFMGIFSDDEMKALAAAFQKKYGIKVNTISSTAEDETTKINAQVSGHALTTDVVQISLTSQLRTWEKDGTIPSSVTLPNAAEIDPTLRTDTPWFPLEFVPLGLAYNTSRLKDSDLPATWDDFLSGKPKALKISTSDPNSTGIPAHLISMLQRLTGTDVLARLAKTYHGVLVSDSSITALQYVVTGEADICFSGAESYVAGDVINGEPVGITYPKGLKDDGVLGQANFVTLLAKAPHPNAAQLLLQYLMSKEGQTVMANLGVRGTLTGLPAPKGAPDISGRPFITPDDNYFAQHGKDLKAQFSKLFS